MLLEAQPFRVKPGLQKSAYSWPGGLLELAPVQASGLLSA
jgi:hypothetical protein